MDAPPPLHCWYPITGSSTVLLSFDHILISPSAPPDLSQSIRGADREAWNALSSLLNECCDSDMLCVDLLNDHELRNDHDSHDAWWDAILIHLLNGMCISACSSCSCKLFACDFVSTAHLSYAFCILLLDAFQNQLIDLDMFSLCCMSVGLCATTTNP